MESSNVYSSKLFNVAYGHFGIYTPLSHTGLGAYVYFLHGCFEKIVVGIASLYLNIYRTSTLIHQGAP